MNTGLVADKAIAQSFIVSTPTPNASPKSSTMSICPKRMTSMIIPNDMLKMCDRLILPFAHFAMSPMKLRRVSKYRVLGRFHNCRNTNTEKNIPNSCLSR